jgi:hypothetical protein
MVGSGYKPIPSTLWTQDVHPSLALRGVLDLFGPYPHFKANHILKISFFIMFMRYFILFMHI